MFCYKDDVISKNMKQNRKNLKQTIYEKEETVMSIELKKIPLQLVADQRALVTGAGRGIGREIARQLALEGADVIVNARRQEDLITLKEEIMSMGRRCLIVAGGYL